MQESSSRTVSRVLVRQTAQWYTLEEQAAVITLILEEELTTSACHQIHNTHSGIAVVFKEVLMCMYGSEYKSPIVGTHDHNVPSESLELPDRC